MNLPKAKQRFGLSIGFAIVALFSLGYIFLFFLYTIEADTRYQFQQPPATQSLFMGCKEFTVLRGDGEIENSYYEDCMQLPQLTSTQLASNQAELQKQKLIKVTEDIKHDFGLCHYVNFWYLCDSTVHLIAWGILCCQHYLLLLLLLIGMVFFMYIIIDKLVWKSWNDLKDEQQRLVSHSKVQSLETTESPFEMRMKEKAAKQAQEQLISPMELFAPAPNEEKMSPLPPPPRPNNYKHENSIDPSRLINRKPIVTS